MSPLRYLVVTLNKRQPSIFKHTCSKAYRFVLLVKIVHVSVQNLHKQFDRHCRVHTGIGNAKRSLQTF